MTVILPYQFFLFMYLITKKWFSSVANMLLALAGFYSLTNPPILKMLVFVALHVRGES